MIWQFVRLYMIPALFFPQTKKHPFTLKKQSVTDRPTYRPTYITGYRVACMRVRNRSHSQSHPPINCNGPRWVQSQPAHEFRVKLSRRDYGQMEPRLCEGWAPWCPLIHCYLQVTTRQKESVLKKRLFFWNGTMGNKKKVTSHNSTDLQPFRVSFVAQDSSEEKDRCV